MNSQQLCLFKNPRKASVLVGFLTGLKREELRGGIPGIERRKNKMLRARRITPVGATIRGKGAVRCCYGGVYSLQKHYCTTQSVSGYEAVKARLDSADRPFEQAEKEFSVDTSALYRYPGERSPGVGLLCLLSE